MRRWGLLVGGEGVPGLQIAVGVDAEVVVKGATNQSLDFRRRCAEVSRRTCASSGMLRSGRRRSAWNRLVVAVQCSAVTSGATFSEDGSAALDRPRPATRLSTTRDPRREPSSRRATTKRRAWAMIRLAQKTEHPSRQQDP